ncbi:MAG: PorV/PorQ family protein [Melioribacteraceae bacterium]|nr:PorV/PorQ family protein [Melioribacteraceae bacterium]MCF8356305.1 PorV/PorQ family protein [Melioribacteraceae bacterium]MCF8395739.1 PorV/PorQ family protein [Melioribacteraceae bacterium]MCF8421230.1 PorV/PorQ family protein [Melioribacteraceae bacterium]
MKKIILSFIIFLMPVSIYSGGFSKVGTAVAQFLKIGVGARASAMGESFAAISNDITALYWNPAGITNINTITFGASHSQWFAEIYHNYAGIVVPLSASDVLGISAVSLSTDEQEVTTVQQPDGAGIFYNVSDLAIGLSYARALTDRFSVGLTVKYIQQNMYNVSAQTVAIDLGTYLRTGFHNLVVAMCVSNFGGNMQLEGRDLIALVDVNKNISGEYNPDAFLKTEAYPLPLNFRVGIAMDIVGGLDPVIQSNDFRVTLAVDGNHPNDNNERLNLGSEFGWNEMLFARIGYKINYDVENWTFGAGVKVSTGSQDVSFDYAMVDYYDLGTVSRFSFEVSF